MSQFVESLARLYAMNKIDEKKIKETEFRYGDITRKCVIYNGLSHIENNIEYINVEEYLLFK
jgi:hypothetical protein